MDTEKTVQFDLELFSEDTSQEELDTLTRQLLFELRDQDIELVELAGNGNAPKGTKAVDPVTIGTIAITVLPTFLPKVVEFIQAWALRGQGNTIKFKGKVAGQTINFEGSADDLQKLVTVLTQAKAQK